ncbi:transcription factor RfeG [Stagonosporopsis vannaccii]|nr:transcription factor RfeG [Stagonosporopsis vannaccii]
MSRANKWFVLADGIAREVITADITRYLGNDALVWPGMGVGEHDGQRGYWITAYRTLTSAMIEDLQANSRRWEQERLSGASRKEYQNSRTNADRIPLGPSPRTIYPPAGSYDHQSAPSGFSRYEPQTSFREDGDRYSTVITTNASVQPGYRVYSAAVPRAEPGLHGLHPLQSPTAFHGPPPAVTAPSRSVKFFESRQLLNKVQFGSYSWLLHCI